METLEQWGTDASALRRTAPVNVTPPIVSGVPTIGQTLVGSAGDWTGSKPIDLSFQWERCGATGTTCAEIAGATSSAYAPGATDVGSTLRLAVTGTNRYGTATARSAATSAVSAPSTTPTPATLGPSQLTSGTVGQPYQATITASGPNPPYTLKVTQGALPSGLALGAAGDLSGTPSSAGSFAFTISAFDPSGVYVAFHDYTLAISAAPSATDAPYYVEHFDGAFNNAFWHVEPQSPYPLSFVDGAVGQAARITNCASSSASSLCSSSTSTYGQLEGFDAYCDESHSGWVAGSGTCGTGGYGKVEDTWYRLRIRFPTGYQPSPGTQNALFEFHVDDLTNQQAKALGGGAYSTLIDVQGQGDVTALCASGSPYFCTSPGTSPRMFIQVPGGPIAQSPSTAVKRFFPLPVGSLLYDHWYDLVLHIVWSPDATVGWVQWWLDGTQILDVHTPTLYLRTDGTYSYGENIDLIDYRLWSNFSSMVDYDELTVGPSAASVGFTP